MAIGFMDIVRLLNIDAPVHFTPREKLDKQNYVSTRIMSDEERDAIFDHTHDISKNYNCAEVGLYFPDIEVDEYYSLECQRNPVAIEVEIEELQKIIPIEKSDISLIWAIFCVLHKYGHWIHFKNSGMTAKEYCEERFPEHKKILPMVERIATMPDFHPNKWMLARELHKIYAELPDERAANEYAIEHIADAVVLIQRTILDCPSKKAEPTTSNHS